MQKKIQKSFFAFEITAFGLVAWNTRFYWENILVIGCEYGKKEFQDIRHFQKGVYGANFLSECKQCFGPFNMFTVNKCSDMGFFGLLSNSAFSSL